MLYSIATSAKPRDRCSLILMTTISVMREGSGLHQNCQLGHRNGVQTPQFRKKGVTANIMNHAASLHEMQKWRARKSLEDTTQRPRRKILNHDANITSSRITESVRCFCFCFQRGVRNAELMTTTTHRRNESYRPYVHNWCITM